MCCDLYVNWVASLEVVEERRDPMNIHWLSRFLLFVGERVRQSLCV